MLTNKFTSIANFVAKLAYKHVMCNTYIPRVYIKMFAISIGTYQHVCCEHRHSIPLKKFFGQEAEFMNQTSVKLNS